MPNLGPGNLLVMIGVGGGLAMLTRGSVCAVGDTWFLALPQWPW